jgi:hypothetical protein
VYKELIMKSLSFHTDCVAFHQTAAQLRTEAETCSRHIVKWQMVVRNCACVGSHAV